ncbi:MAG: bifunctional [glutamine synthetase] adenylyltransferase/[glutamine synthetase]-adenylyl-L-tyrosine phosphorylase [Sphingomonadaceae bacterium]|nr:bifunctional [glutamine synthetase] adenylyltransferase/[glutamine synthetase]-adenylyl-L-tyrosine phosphorylase [Sphingomonadaceae bacterium]
MDGDWQSALERARNHAPFLALGLERQPELAELLAAGKGEEALAWARAAGDGTDDAGIALRREKWALAVALAVGDLAGAFPLARVTGELSSFADRALDRSIHAAISRRVDDCEPKGFLALALGKHGAGELNYSSDIDPILLYDPDSLPRRERDEPGEAAQRYAREIVQIMSNGTADGYVFRVDLRLRPASEVSPLAISIDAATTHYESSALTWERAAYIRARACAGDIAAGEDFLAHIRPFVWRRSLDFGAIEEIRRLTLRIRANYKGPPEPGPGFNLKHGRGGIREVEFFAQTHQLIHGGRDPSLRLRGTRAALDALAAAGRINADDAQVLGDSYDRLRTLEHRLQMVNDHQTHALPEGDALDNVAQLEGLADGAALIAELRDVTEAVAARYDSLIDEEEGSTITLPARASALAVRLAELGYEQPDQLATRIEGWTDGRMRPLRSDAARQAFEACLPALLEALAAAPDRDAALLRWERVLAAMPSAINFFRLLEARPGLMDQLVSVLTLAPPLAEELGRRPELLDALIDRSALDLPGTTQQLASSMRRSESDRGYEGLLDRIRVVTGETRFALGIQLIEAAHDPLDIAAALGRTAEAALQVALDAAQEEFARQHGRIEGAELLVLGLGRLGGGVLTHASDLDIIYLFNGDHAAESDGPRPLGATLYFNRLAQRVTAALSVATAEGALYEIDTRLRPQGTQGPLAVSVDSFDRYQREDAWTWEHMALTRARPVAGSPAACAALSEVIAGVLHRPRDPDVLRADVLKMRSEMAAHKGPRGPLDAKLARGGLVDLEFLVHHAQLRHRTAFSPDLGKAIAELAAQDILPPELVEAHDLLTRLLVVVRLFAPDLSEPSPVAGAALARACGVSDLASLLAAIGDARNQVAAAWLSHFDEQLEV